jgi:hypothetical protein
MGWPPWRALAKQILHVAAQETLHLALAHNILRRRYRGAAG